MLMQNRSHENILDLTPLPLMEDALLKWLRTELEGDIVKQP